MAGPGPHRMSVGATSVLFIVSASMKHSFSGC
jgi:hypothetical protein